LNTQQKQPFRYESPSMLAQLHPPQNLINRNIMIYS
jgi:hypothetical protein